MLAYEARILSALQNAPSIEPGAATLSRDESTPHPYVRLAGLDDLSPLSFGTDPAANDKLPHQIIVPTLREYRTLVNDTALVTGIKISEESVKHEASHSYASLALRAIWRSYIMTFAKVPSNGKIAVQGSSLAALNTTKIGLAAMLAHPQDPSYGDLLSITALGYEDIDDIGYRITTLNENRRPNDLPLPVPLSYKPVRIWSLLNTAERTTH